MLHVVLCVRYGGVVVYVREDIMLRKEGGVYIAKNICHEGATVSPFYLRLCSGGVLI